MKKTIIKALIISGIINIVGCLTNLLCAIFGDFLLIRASYLDGEYQGFIGFGILLERVLNDDHLSFNIINFLLYFVIIFIIVLATIFVIKKIKANKKEK